MSVVWIDTRNVVAVSVIDRIWLEYHREKWHARAGRQRINWGMGTTWNPNDLFNTYNFLDFDYEERPAVDAIKVQYLTGLMDHVEVAASFSKRRGEYDSRREIFCQYRQL
jgi:hypothetical protein